MQIGKGLLVLLLVMSSFAGVGMYQVALAKGLISTCIPYDAVGYQDYTIKPRGGK